MNFSNRSRRYSNFNLNSFLAEPLEDRLQFSTIVVNTPLDGFPSGLISLREAILAANSNSDSTTVTFDPTVFATPQTITLNGNDLEISAASLTLVGPASALSISGNSQSAGFLIDSAVTASLSGITLTRCNGAIYNSGSLTLTNVIITDNSAIGEGGGIKNSGVLNLSQSSVVSNEATSCGGGIFSSDSATLTNDTISNNTANSSGGGGIYSTGSLSLTSVTIANNTTTLDGGGIFTTGSAGIRDCAIINNIGENEAGGIYNGGSAILINDTVGDNSTEGDAGGIMVSDDSSNTVKDSTVSGNFAPDGTGGFYVDPLAYTYGDNPVTITNCIVAGNSSGDGGADDCSGPFISLGYNLIGETTGSTGWNANGPDLVGSAAQPLSPQLSSLGMNGGSTETFLPLAGSPAIGAGSVALVPTGITTDQRGLSRIVNGHVDIGAVESEAIVTVLAFAQQPGATTTTATLSPITVHVEDSSGNLLTGDSSEVTLTIVGGTTGAMLGGTLTEPVVDGVATFSDLFITSPGQNYTLLASDGSDTSATSASFAISAPVINRVAFVEEPADSTMSSTLGSMTVDVEDSNGHLLSSDSSVVTLAIFNSPSGAVLGGTTTVAAINGVATFANISASKPGSYILQASDGADTSAASNEFTVTTLLTLADLSSDVYSSTPVGADGYRLLGTDREVNNFGYAANSYASADNSQIVVAVRGTAVGLTITFLKNLIADLSFGGNDPTTLLTSEVADTASFVKGQDVGTPLPNITLTGHSLGGAVAQLIGNASGLPTYTFNAPGAAQLASSLSTQLQPVVGLGSGRININYRIFGDQVSQFGTPFSQTVTLPAPPNADVPAPIEGFANQAYDLVSNHSVYLALHSISTVIAQIGDGATSSVEQPDDAQALEALIQPSGSFVSQLGQGIDDYLVFNLNSSLAALIDPGGGSDFELSGQTGSPNFQSVDLPALPNVESYNVRYETNGTWSAFQSIQPGAQDTFGASGNGIEFDAVDANGQPVQLPAGFLFGASFASAGTFSGILAENGAQNAGLSESATALTSSISSASIGQFLTFTATVSALASGGVTPTGSVSFIDQNGDVLATSDVQGNGMAAFTTAFIKAETDTITASYSGDGTYAASTSTSVAESISAAVASPAKPDLSRIVLPSSAIAGQKFNARLPIVITNTGANLSGNFTTNLYAEPTSAADGSEVFLTAIVGRQTIKSGKSKTLTFHLKVLPSSHLVGEYNLVAEVIDPNGAKAWTTSTKSIHISAPFVMPVISIANILSATLVAGKTGTTTITVTNSGNVVATSLNLSLSPLVAGGSTLLTPLVTNSKRLSIRPGASIRLKLKLKIPTGLAVGNYYPFVSITLNGVTASSTGVAPFIVG